MSGAVEYLFNELLHQRYGTTDDRRRAMLQSGYDDGGSSLLTPGRDAITPVCSVECIVGGGLGIRGLAEGGAALLSLARSTLAGAEEVSFLGGMYTAEGHALTRAAERGIPYSLVDQTLARSVPTAYFHDGAWKLGFWNAEARIFVATVQGRITTVMRSSERYIKGLFGGN